MDHTREDVELPVAKRKRTGKACDPCREKKTKCNGRQPCASCVLYEHECTYDQIPRRRLAGPTYIARLEAKLHRQERLLKQLIPGIDLEDPNLDGSSLAQRKAPPKSGGDPDRENAQAADNLSEYGHPEQEAFLDLEFDTSGRTSTDDKGHSDYHSTFAGLSFLQRMRERCWKLFDDDGEKKNLPSLSTLKEIFSSVKPPPSGSKSAAALENSEVLPSKNTARQLVAIALDDACCHLRFIHRPTFDRQLDRIYNLEPESYGDEEHEFLPLLYVMLAIGVLFSKNDADKLGIERIRFEGSKYFRAGQRIIDITDCRTVTSLQTMIGIIYYLQSSAMMSACYSYTCVAIASALRMGLHRSQAFKDLTPVENECRKRIFWALRTMDTNVTTMLGLPRTLSDDDIDQELPLEIDDEFLTDQVSQPPAAEPHTSTMAATNAHIRLVMIAAKVAKYIYSNHHGARGQTGSYRVDYAKVIELENDLTKWFDQLPTKPRRDGVVAPNFRRVQLLLRVAFAHVQMILYRPFLHHVMNCPSDQPANPKSYACASACVKAAKQVIRLVGDLNDRGLLNGAYWFTVFTMFLAIMSLVMYTINNPDDPQLEEIVHLAESGQQILLGLSIRSLTADRCTTFLTPLINKLQASRKPANADTAVNDPAPSQPRNGPWDQWAVSRRSESNPRPQVSHESSQDSEGGGTIRAETITPTHTYFLDDSFEFPLPQGMPEQQQFHDTNQQQDPHAMFYTSMDPSGYIDPSMLLEMPLEDGTRFLAGTPTHWLDNEYMRPGGQNNTSFPG